MSMHQLGQLFKARDPLEYMKPYPDQLGKKRALPYTGVSAYLNAFENPEEYEEVMKTFKPIEQRKERRLRIAQERKAATALHVEQALENWNPSGYTFDTDAYKTLFVGRLSYLTDEHKLKREMEQGFCEQYGPVKSVKLVYDNSTDKPRGYGFVEFEHERDMKTAYKHADGRKIDGRRILVDVERGRTVKDWKPRKCGGGLGSSRKDRPKKTPAEKAEQKRYEAAQAARAARVSTTTAPPAAARTRVEEPPPSHSTRRDDDRGARDDRRKDDRDRGGSSRTDDSEKYSSRSSRGDDYSSSSRKDDYGGSRGGGSSGGGYEDYYRGGGGGGSRYDDYRR